MLNVKEKPYEFMVLPTVQKAWIEGRGILLWAALFLVEFGASLFLVSSFFNCLWGQSAGWLIAGVLGGGCHFLFLGHPFRVYLAIKRPKNAWISRGLIIISLFQLWGLIHLFLAYFSTPGFWLMVTADVMAVATVLLINVFLFLSYLVNLANEEGKKRLALNMMLKGDPERIFWPWVVIGGMVIPCSWSFLVSSLEWRQRLCGCCLLASFSNRVIHLTQQPILDR